MQHRGRRIAQLALLFVGSAPSAAAALDLTGKWRFQPTGGFVFGTPQIVQVTQSGSALSFNFSILPYTGTVSPSVGIANQSAPDECDSFALTETGTRCGTGSVDPNEACDDGNLIDGDGCSAACTVEPCWECSGQPSICVPTPHTPCKASTAAAKCLLSIKNKSDNATDKITWLWKKGAATAVEELGNPVAGDDYALCVYDESTMPPGLLFRAVLAGGGSCDGRPCWRRKGPRASGTRIGRVRPRASR